MEETILLKYGLSHAARDTVLTLFPADLTIKCGMKMMNVKTMIDELIDDVIRRMRGTVLTATVENDRKILRELIAAGVKMSEGKNTQ